MQTFLPYLSLEASIKCLDNKRLGKQRVEAHQIINTLRGGGHWHNHPAVLMWDGYLSALIAYYNICLREWEQRGFNNNMPILLGGVIKTPWFIGKREFHSSHRSNLLRKDFEFYSQWGWKESPNLFYKWPDNTTKSFREIIPKWYKDQQKMEKINVI